MRIDVKGEIAGRAADNHEKIAANGQELIRHLGRLCGDDVHDVMVVGKI